MAQTFDKTPIFLKSWHSSSNVCTTSTSAVATPGVYLTGPRQRDTTVVANARLNNERASERTGAEVRVQSQFVLRVCRLRNFYFCAVLLLGFVYVSSLEFIFIFIVIFIYIILFDLI